MDEKSTMNDPPPPPYPTQGPPPHMGYQATPPPGQPGAYPPGEFPPSSYKPGPAPPTGYAAVPPGPPPMIGTTTVVVQQNFGMIPASCNCPNCHQNVVTRTEYETGLFAWLIAGIIFLCGGWIFCLCLIPFCVDSMKDVRHVCPNCNYTIHYFKRM